MKKHLDVLIYITAAAGLILIIVACGPLFSTPETTPTSVGTEPAFMVNEPVDYEPVAGTTIPWVDMSYVVYVPPGDFQMGEDETEPSDHSPAHTVTLDGFWIHQTEVTNRMYALCVDLVICSTPYHETGKPYWYANPAHADAPVVGVDWYQAETYCEWIDGRLPTEAEWEKAARGTEGDPNPWGDEDPTCNLLNFAGCFEPVSPVDVRSYFYGASPFELADTAGNVSEWVLDWYDEEYYAVPPSQNPTGPADGDFRVVRGSNYDSVAGDVPVYLRAAVDPLEHHAEVGFRCVLTGETIGDPPPSVCEMPAYSPPAVDTGQPLEPDIPSITATSYCILYGFSHGYVNLVFDGPIEMDDFVFTSTAGEVGGEQAENHPDTLVLYGPGIPVDQAFELTICPVVVISQTLIEEPGFCPADFILDPETGKCQYLALMPGKDCEEGQVQLEGFGCVWVWADSDPETPRGKNDLHFFKPGFRVIIDDGKWLGESSPLVLLLPVDGSQDCEDDPNCSTNTECLPGLTYVPDSDCCAYPPEFDPICPTGYNYDPDLMQCVAEDPGYQCTSFSFYIPSCEAPQVTVCQNPGQYKDKASCEAAFCRWVPAALVPEYCTYP
ncbi:MAG: formylglycine-generating enzyme family protein [Chloroflexi bacterium]|nr:formylglycine-generating enzyme family protein [Chloroflexota bacterium]